MHAPSSLKSLPSTASLGVSIAAKFPLRARGAVERELRRLVVGEVRLPALAIRREPYLAALGALGMRATLSALTRRSLGRTDRSNSRQTPEPGEAEEE